MAPAPTIRYRRSSSRGDSASSNAIGRDYVREADVVQPGGSHQVVIVPGISVAGNGVHWNRCAGFVETAQGMGVTDSLQRCREFLVLFGKDVLGREPSVEADVLQQGPQVSLHTREQHGDAAVDLLPHKLLDPLDYNGIRVAHTLDPQHE